MELKKLFVILIDNLKYFGIFLGVLMYYWTLDSFGVFFATILGGVFGISFIYICTKGYRFSLCEYISEDIRDVLFENGAPPMAFHVEMDAKYISLKIALFKEEKKEIDIGALREVVKNKIENSWYKKSVLSTELSVVEDFTKLMEGMKWNQK